MMATTAQIAALRSLDYLTADGVPPTVRQVADDCGIAISTAHARLYALERHGLAVRVGRDGAGRALFWTVTDDGRKAL